MSSSCLVNMVWSEIASSQSAPTIKNHSVTYYHNDEHHMDHLLCFGGYDGLRNHMTLLLYDLQQSRWIRPVSEPFHHPIQQQQQGNHQNNPNHTATSDTIVEQGSPPPGRNGHSATLAVCGSTARIIIIGGWLGTGPLAASDMHVLDIVGRTLQWNKPPVKGTPPGPCNMHSADYVSHKQEVYVFRGGNGREYLNDLHALHIFDLSWRKVETTGQVPQQRANHSSAILEHELFIFGGWNGTERLNDIHILDTRTSTWTFPNIGGTLPHPRAGMTLTALRGRLYLFGGSGTSAKCFNDLQILDRQEMAWLDVSQNEFGYTNNVNNTHRYGDLLYRQQSVNPNDEESIPRVIIHGNGPSKRAGHTATAVNRRIFVFGGSCGAQYLSDFFQLDTDPTPHVAVTERNSLQLVEDRVKNFFNNEEFHDVVFLVEGQRVYGHKMILSIASDCFRAMFTAGFREANDMEIEIPDCTHAGFMAVMEYIYTGDVSIQGDQLVIEVLELADRFFLNHLKQMCEDVLQKIVNADSAEYLLSVAQRANATQLQAVCEHYMRNRGDNHL